MLDYLKELCLLDGTSGREEKVREYIISKIKDKCEYKIDPMGNILADVKGKNPAKNKVMLSAHMDEVGFIVTYICDNGFLKFNSVGGVDSKVVNGRFVTVGENRISGVIASKALHLCEGDEEHKVSELSKLYIDIGASSKEEAEKLVEIGDAVYFKSDFVEFGSSKIKAKAIDDRFGCAIMLKMIEETPEFDTTFAFLVQEEVGLRGAGPAAFTVDPDYAIVLEATTASDISFVSDEDSVCRQGKGAVVFISSNTAYRAIPDRVAYVASKGGQLGLMRALALDLGKYGIRVNAILPGMIKTDRWEKNPDFYRDIPSRFTPIGDVAVGEDVADAVYYFAAHARNTTGAELTVDGGNTIQLYPIIPKS